MDFEDDDEEEDEDDLNGSSDFNLTMLLSFLKMRFELRRVARITLACPRRFNSR